MSEAEKKRRQSYRQNRKKWILIQSAAIAVLMLISLIMLFVFNQQSKTYYIEYSESGKADYSVNLKESEFFPDGVLDSNRGYVSELIESIFADFEYHMIMNSDSVKYEYNHKINATLKVTNNRTGTVLFEHTDVLSESESLTSSKNKLFISERVSVDFAKYNELAKDFISTYDLKSVSANLTVGMAVGVTGNCPDLENTQHSAHTSSIMIPLNEDMIDINTTASSPAGEVQVLACKNNVNPTVFKILAIIFFALALIMGGIFAGFVYLTRNEDINYEIKVKKLVSSYRSYIQTATNGFDFEGYQTVKVASFIELLGIRDTTQFPILMVENEDKTKTEFFVPTNTRIVYLFEIKVDNYDALYSDIVTEEPVFEETVITADVDREELAIAMASPDVVLSEIDYVDEDENIEELSEGTEVIGVVWPEKTKQNKVYKYDPAGEQVAEGDIVLVPSRDVHQDKDIIRKAAVAHANYKVDSESLSFPLKKIIGVVKRTIKNQLEK